MNQLLQQINALLPDNHTEEISEADVREAFRNTLTGVQKWLNELTLGGRNLLPGTRDMSGNQYSTNTNEVFLGFKVAKAVITKSSYVDTALFKTIHFPKEEVYTLSFWAKTSVAANIFCYFHTPSNTISAESSTGGVGSSSDGACAISATSEWKKYWVTWRQGNTNDVKHITIGRCFTPGVTVFIAGVKLEAGKNATDWTPAPEDVENKITNLFKNLPDVTHDPTYNKALVVKPDGSLGTINRK